MSFFEELRRRKVLKVGGAYLVLAWLSVQVASIVFPTFDAPLWVLRVFILVLALGFPIAVVMAWLLEATPEGLKIEPAAKGNKRIFSGAAAVAALAIAWYFVGQPALRDTPAAAKAAAPAAADAPAAPKGPPARSIAVLPFVDLSQSKDQEYFSDGITEEILNALTRIEGLKVAGRTSSFHFKGRNDSLIEIGKALGVSHVLEGSVRKQGERVRITAQLIKVEDGFHVWSQNYNRKLDDIFAVQDEISEAIASALKSKLDAEGGAGGDIDPAAYDTYLRARQQLVDRDAGRLRRAAELFAQVTQVAPGFDAAWAGRSKALALYFNYAGGKLEDAPIDEARASAERALTLNPGNAEALSMLAFTNVAYRWRFEDGLREIREAIAVAPNDAEVANFAGDVFRLAGELDEALKWERRAVDLDPLADFNQSDYGVILLARHRYREALAASEHALRIDPSFWAASDLRARALLGLGDRRQALAEVEQLAKSNPGTANELELRARIASLMGDSARAHDYLGRLEARARAGETLQYTIAIVQLQLGEEGAAADWLRRAFEARDPVLVSDFEFIHRAQWPDLPAAQAVFAQPELAPMYARRARYAEDRRNPPVAAP